MLDDIETPISRNIDILHPNIKRALYKIFCIKNIAKDKTRWIFSPDKHFKVVQKCLLNNIFYKFATALHPSVIGCLPKSSIQTSISPMYGAPSIYVSDIKSFFKSVRKPVIFRAIDRLLLKSIKQLARHIRHTELIKKGKAPGQRPYPKYTLSGYNLNVKMIFDYIMLHEYSDSINDYAPLPIKRGSSLILKNIYSKLHIHHKSTEVFDVVDPDLHKEVQMFSREEHLALKTITASILSGLYSIEFESSQWWRTEASVEIKNRDLPNINLHQLLCGEVPKQPEGLYTLFRNGSEETTHVIEKINKITDKGSSAQIELCRRILYTLADIVLTHYNSLPEGAVTSPMLANIVLDSVHSQVIKHLNIPIRYAAYYMDDISLAFDKKITPTDRKAINKAFDKALNLHGLRRHYKKTHVYNSQRYRAILGVNLTEYNGNDGITTVRVTRKFRRQLKADINSLWICVRSYLNYTKEFKLLTPTDEYVEKNYPKGYTKTSHFSFKRKAKEILGKIAWLQSISPHKADKYRAKMAKIKAKLAEVEKTINDLSANLIEVNLTGGI